jgi:tetratricopeptide (TPR) repeat protein
MLRCYIAGMAHRRPAPLPKRLLPSAAWRAAGLLAAGFLAGCGALPGGTVDRSARIAAVSTTPPPGASPFGRFLVGRFAAEEQDDGIAADALLLTLQSDPEQRDVLQLAFQAALMDGRPDALRLARRLPDNLAAQLVLFGSDIVGARWDRAEARVRALPRPGAVQSLQPVLTAWALAGRGQTDAALALLRPLADGGRLRALNALHAALIADIANRPRDAERFLRIAMADQPDPTMRMSLLAAGILNRAGRTTEAQRLLDGLAASHEDMSLAAQGAARARVLGSRAIAGPADGVAEAYVALGAALRGHGLEELSGTLARLALRLRPSFGPALMLLADTLSEADRHEAALTVLERVAAEDPLHGPARLRQALLLDRLERLPEAERLLADLAAAHPRQPQPLLHLGDILRRRGRFAEAVRAYDAALARLPEVGEQDWQIFYARGISRERAGDWPGAEQDLLRAISLSPDQPYVLNYLGFSWADKGINLDRAREMLERALALRPEDGNIVDSLGWVMFRMGDYPAAILWLERAVELEPRNATINDHLGDAYWMAGRQNEARFQWSRALSMEPGPVEAARLNTKLAQGLPMPPLPRAASR